MQDRSRCWASAGNHRLGYVSGTFGVLALSTSCTHYLGFKYVKPAMRKVNDGPEGIDVQGSHFRLFTIHEAAMARRQCTGRTSTTMIHPILQSGCYKDCPSVPGTTPVCPSCADAQIDLLSIRRLRIPHHTPGDGNMCGDLWRGPSLREKPTVSRGTFPRMRARTPLSYNSWVEGPAANLCYIQSAPLSGATSYRLRYGEELCLCELHRPHWWTRPQSGWGSGSGRKGT